MTTAAILPVPLETGGVSYRGVAGDIQSQGRTMGQALDALTAQLPDAQSGLLILVQSFQPDRFFDASQQARLGELMEAQRQANAANISLPPGERAELTALIDAELYASADRAALLADQSGR